LVKLLQSGEEIPYAEVTRALGGILDHIDSGSDFKTLGLYPLILRGLRSNVPDVQILALNQVKKIMEGKGGDEDEITVALIDCLGAEDARVGEVAVKVLSNVTTLLKRS
jgi:Proteasome non-ATPase 26S subunit